MGRFVYTQVGYVCTLAGMRREDLVQKVAEEMRDTAHWADEEVIEGRMDAFEWWLQLAEAAVQIVRENED